ncbi:MAG: T9SS type A sorting domain-containing protein, partial [Leeuwenhoekiella sp.]
SGWSTLRNFGNRLTYDTQPTSFFSVKGSAATSYFYVGDRWKDPELTESKIIFLPMEASNGNLTLQYVPEFKINMDAGTWEASDNNNYVSKDNWSIISISSQQNTTSFAAENVFDNDISSIWNTRYTSGFDQYPHEMVIDLGDQFNISGFTCVPRQDISGNTISDFQLFLSEDGTNWGVPVAAGRMSYWSELYFETKTARFMKLVGRADLNGSRFASASELKLITNSQYSAERSIIPYFNPDGKGWRTGDKILVERGGQALIGIQTEFESGQTPFYGSFSYNGPNGYYANTRIINLQNINEEQLGSYTITYLNDLFSAQQHTYEMAFTMITKELNVENVICGGNSTGTASIEVEGGFLPYIYEWSDGQKTQEAVNLVAGTYQVEVTDSEGNSITESIIVEESESINFELTENQKIYLGYGEECVTLVADSVAGGTGDYSYIWSTGEVSDSIDVCPVETSVYSLEIADSNGCTVTKMVTVEVEDVNCTRGNGMNKVEICWKGKQKCVAESALPALLRQGATIGSCDKSNQLVFKHSSAYPNPTTDIAILKVISRYSTSAHIAVRNTSGLQVSSENIRLEKGENHFEVDLSDQISGIYLVKIQGANSEIEIIKVIKK